MVQSEWFNREIFRINDDSLPPADQEKQMGGRVIGGCRVRLIAAIGLTWLAILALLPGCSDSSKSHPKDVSLIQIVAQPEELEGDLVRVAGFLIMSEFTNVLYVSSEDADFHNMQSGIFVDRHTTPQILMELEQASMKYVLLEGILEIEDQAPVLMKTQRVMVKQRLGLDGSRISPLQLTE
jgi:hypothetical protein